MNDGLTLHATLVTIGDEGILLLGDPGVGKSTAALDYLCAGGRLIADDVVIIQRIGDGLFGTAPVRLQGIISIPRLGIFDVREVLGPRYHDVSCRITRCIRIRGREGDDLGSASSEFLEIRLPQSYRTAPGADDARFSPRIDVPSVRQSEHRFLQAHNAMVASASFL